MAEKIMKNGTFIDGIAASEALDSSGEVLVIGKGDSDGLDITSLAKTGVINFEHKNDTPDQTVGKIIKAKKINSEEDCSGDRELYFWKKYKLPILYIVAELFDGVGHQQATEVAAMLRYDSQKRASDPNYMNTIGFSVEGGKIEKQQNIVTRSIARKITVTLSPCNKTAIAEIHLPNQKPKKSSTLDLSSIFKTENPEAIEILAKADILPFSKPLIKPLGAAIGKTTSGKPVHQNGMPKDYKGFSSQDHTDAMNIHYKAAQNAPSHKIAQGHLNASKMHMGAVNTAQQKENRFSQGKQQTIARALGSVKKSQDVAPSALTGQAALQREHVSKKIRKQAEDAYAKIKDKKTLIKSVMDSNPNLFKHQAEVLAKMAAYRDMKKSEAKMAKLHKKIKKD